MPNYHATIDLTPNSDGLMFRWQVNGEDRLMLIPAQDIQSCLAIAVRQQRLEEKPWFTPELSKKFEMLAVAMLCKHHMVEHNAELSRRCAGRN